MAVWTNPDDITFPLPSKSQIVTLKRHRAGMPEGVITIVEYGIAFLGPYCAVEARMLERQNGKWITRTEYSVSTDEKRRRDTYVRQ